MRQGTVVITGGLPIEHLALDGLVSRFGWSLEQTDGLRGLADLSAKRNVVAVLFSPGILDLPWEQALPSVLDAAPSALAILCHDFAETIDWPQAADAGAFHSLLLPLNLPEVQQSLGFVWGAKRRAAPIPISGYPRLKTAIREQARGGARVSGIVA
jgi:hypothetical protein